MKRVTVQAEVVLTIAPPNKNVESVELSANDVRYIVLGVEMCLNQRQSEFEVLIGEDNNPVPVKVYPRFHFKKCQKNIKKIKG